MSRSKQSPAVYVIDVGNEHIHEAVNAFWTYWAENGVTHKHGYYESTWGAINAALRIAGVRKLEEQ